MIKCPNPKCSKMWGWCFNQDTYIDENKMYCNTTAMKPCNDPVEKKQEIEVHQCTCGEVLGVTHITNRGGFEWVPDKWQEIDWEQHAVNEY